MHKKAITSCSVVALHCLYTIPITFLIFLILTLKDLEQKVKATKLHQNFCLAD